MDVCESRAKLRRTNKALLLDLRRTLNSDQIPNSDELDAIQAFK